MSFVRNPYGFLFIYKTDGIFNDHDAVHFLEKTSSRTIKIDFHLVHQLLFQRLHRKTRVQIAGAGKSVSSRSRLATKETVERRKEEKKKLMKHVRLFVRMARETGIPRVASRIEVANRAAEQPRPG